MMRRRITMALLPIMYKLGVSTTLLGVLVFIGIKTAAMVSVLFVLALGSLAKKFGAFGGGGGYHSAHWPPPPVAAPVQKEVHVHVHADPHKQVVPPWYRKHSPDEYESLDADPYGGGPYNYGPSGYASSYDEPQPQVLYRAPYRRWPTARSRPSTSTAHTSPWSSSHPQLTETVAASAPAPAYAMHPRWTWQRYMEQEYPLDLAKTLRPEKVKGSN